MKKLTLLFIAAGLSFASICGCLEYKTYQPVSQLDYPHRNISHPELSLDT